MAPKTQSSGTTKRKSTTKKKKEEVTKKGPTAAAKRAVWAAAQGKSLDDLDKHIDESESQEAAAAVGRNMEVLLAEAQPDPVSRAVAGFVARHPVAKAGVNALKAKGVFKEALTTKGDVVDVFNYGKDLVGKIL